MGAALLGGGIGGLAAAALAQFATTLCDRAGHSQSWLQGRFGPPFFNVALFMGLLYGGIACGLSRRRGDVLVGALGPFLGIAAPLAALERVADLPWYSVVVGLFITAVWGTVAALGWRLGRGLRGAFGAVLGAFCGYLVLSAVSWAAPRLVAGTTAVLLDGLLTGAGIGSGIVILRRDNAGNA